MEYIHPKKELTETLHHALHAMMQFPVIFLADGYFHPQTKN
jgi:hypothetical protein